MTATRVGSPVSLGRDKPRVRRRIRPLGAFGAHPGRWSAVVAFALALLHGPAIGFVYDAGGYWGGARTVAEGWGPTAVYTAGWLAVRGVGTVLVYVPSIWIEDLGGGAAGKAAVLAQNAALIAFVGAFLVPRLVRLVVPPRPVQVWASAILCSLLLAGFAPYPLMDLWALALVFTGVLLVCRAGRWSTLWGALLLGLAVNLRPAYLIPVVLAAIVWLLFRWRTSIWALVGAVASVVPQVIVNRTFAGSWVPWPVQSFFVTNVQTQYASYVVRYDTVPWTTGRSPQQFFCSPSMASAVQSHVPTNAGELMQVFLSNFGTATVFVLQKVSATLFWSFVTPYANGPGDPSVLTPVVVVVTALGLVTLLGLLLRVRVIRMAPAIPVILAICVGSVITLASATPETRFALPFVLAGVIGCVLLIPGAGGRRRLRPAIGATVAAALLATALFALGSAGVAHPAQPGDVTASRCLQR